MDLYHLSLAEKQRLLSKEKHYMRELNNLPEGTLTSTKNGKYNRFFLTKDGKRTYLPKAESKLVQDLAKRRYLEASVRDAEDEIAAIDFYLRHHKDSLNTEKLLNNEGAVSEILKEILSPEDEQLRRWAEEDFPVCTDYAQYLIHPGPFGKLYRSKTEAEIAFLLVKNRIPFRYEWIREINGIMYPVDFTIRHPKNGNYIFWEHFGKIDSISYAAKIGPKLHNFECAGIFPGVNLIMTFESAHFPININQLEEVVRRWFL